MPDIAKLRIPIEIRPCLHLQVADPRLTPTKSRNVANLSNQLESRYVERLFAYVKPNKRRIVICVQNKVHDSVR